MPPTTLPSVPRALRQTLALPIAIGASVLLLAAGVLRTLTAEPAPGIHILWSHRISEARRHDLEKKFALTNPEHTPPTWAYELLDTSQENVLELLKHPDVEDTGDLDENTLDISGTAPYGDRDTWIAYRLPFIRQPTDVLTITGTVSFLLIGSLLVIRLTGD